jgi:hypothetical protein
MLRFPIAGSPGEWKGGKAGKGSVHLESVCLSDLYTVDEIEDEDGDTYMLMSIRYPKRSVSISHKDRIPGR